MGDDNIGRLMSVEGYFSIFKRGIKGVHQHCTKKHLHRYAAEFEFRYNNRVVTGVEEVELGENALCSVLSKRLTHEGSDIR